MATGTDAAADTAADTQPPIIISEDAPIAPGVMVIFVDDREKRPYTFESLRGKVALPFVVQPAHLKTGDYMVRTRCDQDASSLNFSDQIVIERKSLQDLYCTLGQHRDRFEREFERLSLFGHAELVIEATWDQIMQPLKYLNHPSELSPRSVFRTLVAWEQRYRVHVKAYPGRQFAEQAVFRSLERWVRDEQEGKRGK